MADETTTPRERTARRDHECMDCGEIIPSGHKYIDMAIKDGKNFKTYKRCSTCHAKEIIRHGH